MCDAEGFWSLGVTEPLWKICEKEMNQSITVVWVDREKVIEVLAFFGVRPHHSMRRERGALQKSA